MKAVLRFDLTDEVDAQKFRRYCKADDMAYVLLHLCEDEDVPVKVRKVASEWCSDNNINFNEIYT